MLGGERICPPEQEVTSCGEANPAPVTGAPVSLGFAHPLK